MLAHQIRNTGVTHYARSLQVRNALFDTMKKAKQTIILTSLRRKRDEPQNEKLLMLSSELTCHPWPVSDADEHQSVSYFAGQGDSKS